MLGIYRRKTRRRSNEFQPLRLMLNPTTYVSHPYCISCGWEGYSKKKPVFKCPKCMGLMSYYVTRY
jgi:predicted Zn-ribbon and HTH transcriptional regulator